VSYFPALYHSRGSGLSGRMA